MTSTLFAFTLRQNTMTRTAILLGALALYAMARVVIGS